jgi:hypothetical protein
MNSNNEKFVVKVENRNAVGNPLYYENFLAIFPDCPRQDTPTNDIIGPYGYEVFMFTEQPTVGRYEKTISSSYIFQDNTWTNFWQTVPMTPEEIQKKQEYQWKLVRQKRTSFLRNSDWTRVLDVALSNSDVELWETYRQQLRDIPEMYSDPLDVVFPDPPYPFEEFSFPETIIV